MTLVQDFAHVSVGFKCV